MPIDIINKQDLTTKIKEKSVVFIDFYATWCGPCIAFGPIYQKIASEFSGKALFLKVNVDEHRDVAVEYRISSIPTIVCLKNGIVCWSHTGNLSEQSFKEKVENIIK